MFDTIALIKAAGYLGVGAVVFAESGLLIGVILPGDSLLFTAGFLASQGYLHIIPLTIVAFVAAVLGDNVGYRLGKRFGPSVFSRKGSFLWNPEHIITAQRFYEQHGAKTIILARFIPVVRTLAPVLAGVGSMDWKTFGMFNVIGGFLWAVGLTVGGYVLGASVPNADQYLLPIIIAIIIVSTAPGLWHLWHERRKRNETR